MVMPATATTQKHFDLSFNATLKSLSKPDSKCYYIEGYASTDDFDYQGEQIQPFGIDLSYFLKQGKINWEHSDDPDDQIGYPLTDGTYTDEHGLHLKAALFADMPIVQKIINLSKRLENANSETGEDKKIGLSIEGNTQTRDDGDDNVITSILITGCAVTLVPANAEADFRQVAKSLMAKNKKVKALEASYDANPSTMQDGAALQINDMCHAIHVLNKAKKDKNCDEIFSQTYKSLLDSDDYDPDEIAFVVSMLNEDKSMKECKKAVQKVMDS